jgi:hypothetical protein
MVISSHFYAHQNASRHFCAHVFVTVLRILKSTVVAIKISNLKKPLEIFTTHPKSLTNSIIHSLTSGDKRINEHHQ